MPRGLAIFLVVFTFPITVGAQTPQLLRNATLQDDWITLLPETKNHHWCYPTEFFNRRDYNPDGWTLKGSWHWDNADAAPGQRRVSLTGPGEISQRIPWVLLHDDRQRESFPDAGGFPAARATGSKQPLRVVRDLTFRVRLKGQDLPAQAGFIDLALCPVGAISMSDPLGVETKPLLQLTTPLPDGTFAARWVEVKLAAADWLKVAPKEKDATVLPGLVRVGIRYQGKSGRLEIERAELVPVRPIAPNLLANAGFESAENDWPTGWSQPIKYRYFPPGHYYIFNTWHNANYPDRGPTQRDALVAQEGKHSLHMIVAAGDEKCVVSSPIVLNQTEARLIEVAAWIKTDHLAHFQIDAVDDKGTRLDCFNVIHKAPVTIGTDDWRMVRQLFRPRTPVKSLRLQLAARGVNGYTLDDTGPQPQNTAVGNLWWDDLHLCEPESTVEELQARGVKLPDPVRTLATPALRALDLGEQLHGVNTLTATIYNPAAAARFTLELTLTAPTGKSVTVKTEQDVPANGSAPVTLAYTLAEPCPAYSEYRGTLTLRKGTQVVGITPIWMAPWETPLDLELGALYLQPEQQQMVRLNLGLSAATLRSLQTVRLELIRRRGGVVLKRWEVAATPAALAAQRNKIPLELREDFRNLLLADLDMTLLPLQPFAHPERNWFLRASVLDGAGKEVSRAESAPFCRQAHEAKQPGVQSVRIQGDLLYVNDTPWLPWGVTYGHTPAYAGPASGVKFRDLANLPPWSIYDRHNSDSSTRHGYDFNCLRYVAGSITDPDKLLKQFNADNLLCSSAFPVPGPVFSRDELFKAAGGKEKLDARLALYRNSPAIVSSAAGIEEAFGLFLGAKPEQLQGMEEAVKYIRQQSGKPVMVGHGGYWNRLEFEKVPFFDIYDPETEPFFPANLHTDLRPLVEGKDKVIWLRPQMYEDVPYERWRFHVFVEMMRGARGWQMAHGPGDASLFRGLHGEVEFFKPILASRVPGPPVRVTPQLEQWSRQHQGKLYVMAASTHGLAFGRWTTQEEVYPGGKRVRITATPHEHRDEANAYGLAETAASGPGVHGVQNLPDARAWPKGTKLVQWVRLDDKARPENLVLLLKTDGRWTSAASWGKVDLKTLRTPQAAYWFLLTFYRHAKGFLGWDTKLVERALEFIPDKTLDQGAVPAAGKWVQLEVPLDKVRADGRLLDGVGMLHATGRVAWGRTALVTPDGKETVVWGDDLGLPAEALRNVHFAVPGLAKGTKIRVLFEDRELTADSEGFHDDFRGQDLFQRFGGLGAGYGAHPVSLHLYEIPLK